MRKWKWPVVWLVQILIMLAAGFAAAAAVLAGSVVHSIVSWGVMPVLGLISACRATRRGLLNYAAWIAPPVCMAAANWICWGYLPSFGPVLICALVSLVGAAAGEVMNQNSK